MIIREHYMAQIRPFYESDLVKIITGIRRCGKSVILKQVLNELEAAGKRCLFLDFDLRPIRTKIPNADALIAYVNDYLGDDKLYVFLDEVTMMEDFIEGAALFSDVFAASGMKIVLSGIDLFTEDQQLYDRCILLHTTLIPYREFDRVLGIQGIDEYIRYGGTMSIGGVQYNAPTFATKQSTDEYVDSAIA